MCQLKTTIKLPKIPTTDCSVILGVNSTFQPECSGWLTNRPVRVRLFHLPRTNRMFEAVRVAPLFLFTFKFISHKSRVWLCLCRVYSQMHTTQRINGISNATSLTSLARLFVTLLCCMVCLCADIKLGIGWRERILLWINTVESCWWLCFSDTHNS